MTRFDLPKEAPLAECRSCGVKRPLDDYRFFRTKPFALYMDFCRFCEQTHGTLTLYRRYNAYGTPEVVEAVLAAARVPEEKRNDAQVRLLVAPKAFRPPETNAEVVERELARRELAKRRLIFFTTSFDAKYTPGWVHQDIARRLERFVEQIERRESPRLMLFLPPRAGKSRLASDMFPSWVIGHHPEWEIMQASYGAELAEQFSRNIRDRVRDEEYQAIFPGAKLRSDSQSIGTWRTTAGGGYAALGVGGAATGRGFMVGIVDDPLKDAEAAASETIRENTWAWYQAVFRTRGAPGAGILVIQTRWHDADLSGKLLALEAEQRRAGIPEEEIDRWEGVEYPAIATDNEYLLPDGQVWRGELPADVDPSSARLLREKGGALHPERYPLRELLKTRHSLAPSVWSALYQQNPTPDDGDFFKRGDLRFRHIDAGFLKGCRVFVTADYAIKKKQKNDFTVIAVFALDSDDHLYCVDIERGRWGTFEIADRIVSVVARYKPEVYAGEQGHIHAAVWPVVQKMLHERRLSVSVDETLTPVQEKEVRARPLQARTQQRRFWFAYDQPEVPEVYRDAEKEMLRFPNGTFDDVVDALAWGARLALNLSPPRPAAKPAKARSWRDALTATEFTHMAA